MVIGRKLSKMACQTEDIMYVTRTEKELRMKTRRQKTIVNQNTADASLDQNIKEPK